MRSADLLAVSLPGAKRRGARRKVWHPVRAPAPRPRAGLPHRIPSEEGGRHDHDQQARPDRAACPARATTPSPPGSFLGAQDRHGRHRRRLGGVRRHPPLRQPQGVPGRRGLQHLRGLAPRGLLPARSPRLRPVDDARRAADRAGDPRRRRRHAVGARAARPRPAPPTCRRSREWARPGPGWCGKAWPGSPSRSTPNSWAELSRAQSSRPHGHHARTVITKVSLGPPSTLAVSR